ncbi:PREDICTED: disease resistance protein RPS4-like [Camelina sativa]|uniref:ADP-ribosyl cyclase/cyclic ADP-ribose hydrolase n=1 Tax=Camelina sativa TaxID=90675 RepID=A0ABM0Y7Y0_CAMSA|nr:PREDICTED: disease resistance protein RPS4-like [Camelina sativa]XP_010496945.1 PREDICTED: disease resistance protein RPS4-like [Camelina sativa]
MAASSSDLPPQHQVFINFRGEDLRLGFVSHLVEALENDNIKVFIDNYADKGEPLETLLTKIQESRIALAIFSGKYTESTWCLRELAMIKDCVEKGKLVAIPVFYKLEPSTVRGVRGQFGDAFRDLEERDVTKKKEWKKALKWIPDLIGITVHEKSPESEILNQIVKEVKKALKRVSSEGSPKASVEPSEDIFTRTSSGGEKDKTFGIKERLKELEDKLDLVKYKGTRVIGVVGMPGIGKTTLLKELIETWEGKFSRHALIHQIREKANNFRLECLPTLLLEKLLPELNNPQIDCIEEPYKTHKGLLRERKVLVVLDDVSGREQIDALLGKYDLHSKHEWIKDGSRIVIATNDMSLLKGLVHDTYVVRQLNHIDGLQLFRYHAFHYDQAIPPKVDFMKLSDEFVLYARGHPLALKILGRELYEKNIKHWETKLKILAQSPTTYIGEVVQVSYDELSSAQKDAFLDIACFRSQDVDYVESLLFSSDPGSAEAIKVLKNKFLIDTCDGRVEMHDLLYTFSRELDLKASTQGGSKQRRLWLHQDIINVQQKTMGAADVRGIFLDLSEMKGETSLDREHFKNMHNLRYLKFYNSHCPHECKTNNKINLPDGLKLPLKEVRCLQWLKFPLEELPNDFDPINLVDLKLPYSEIERLWDGLKDTPVLKWVDLNHSSKLTSLSGLSKAQNLQRLNLEGCTSLLSLRDVNLISLKILTLSNCSNFKEFPLIPENLEALYLDGTAISQLPDNVVNLKRLVLLNMKDCRMLENIPTCVGDLKCLQKLVLSGCLKLHEFPGMNKSTLKVLLLDGTSIKTMPLLPSVQYLCLSINDQISYIPAGINQLSHLTQLDLKYCTKLTSIPELPPTLQHLDAHGCSSLKNVAKPLVRIMSTVQNHCAFNFTNCGNLEQAAKEEITSYAQRKCQLLSDARRHYNGGRSSEALFSTCFPGCEVPSWFGHEAVGSLLQRKLLPHWHVKRLSGIALCAVVSFPDSQDQISCFSVACTFKIKVEGKSWVPFTCPVGIWTREGDKKDKIQSDHVFIAYISSPHTIRCLEDENSDKCAFSEASLEFTVTGGTSEIGIFKVLKCGLNLVYENDKNKNSSHWEKYDVPVEASFQEPEHRIMEEERNIHKGRCDDKRPKKKRKTKRDDIMIISTLTQTCVSSVTPRMEDKLSG